MERSVELDVADRLPLVRDVDLRIGLRCLVLQHIVPGAREGAVDRIEIDLGIDGDDLRLGQRSYFLKSSRTSPGCRAALRGEELIEHVGVVVVPGAAADRDQHQDDQRRSRPGSGAPAQRLPPSSAPRRASAMEKHASTAKMAIQYTVDQNSA